MRDDWTFEDQDRLLREALDAQDGELISRILHSDNFEPSLGAENGIITLGMAKPRCPGPIGRAV